MSFGNDLLGAIRRCVPIFLRLALGVTFLTAVADRFGLCGQFGTPNVAWGEFGRFTQYTGQLNPWAPAALVPGLAWAATAAEMSMGTGIKSALNASVFSAAAAAFALAVLGPGPWSVDGLRRGSPTRGRAA